MKSFVVVDERTGKAISVGMAKDVDDFAIKYAKSKNLPPIGYHKTNICCHYSFGYLLDDNFYPLTVVESPEDIIDIRQYPMAWCN